MTTYRVRSDGEEHTVEVEWVGDGYEARMNGETWTVQVGGPNEGSKPVEVAREDHRPDPEETGPTPTRKKRKNVSRPRRSSDVYAPVSGKVLTVNIEPGESVEANEVVLVLEAMKMESEVTTSSEGVVETVHVEKGRSVEEGDLLVEVEPST